MSRAPDATVGGQAVIEGVMMRAPSGWAVAVRTPSGEIEAQCHDLPRLSSRSRLARMPLVRGVMVLGESLTLGFRSLTWSAQKAVGEDEEPLTRRQLAVSMTVALVLFTGLFLALPVFAARWLAADSTALFLAWEAVIRIGLFVGYIAVIGLSQEIRRVFQYHGAEHKTIHAYEAGDPLVADKIQVYSPAHPRCGTSFLLIVVLAAVVVFTLIGRQPWLWLILSRLLLIPVIAGASYEVLRFSGLRADRRLGRVLSAPGMWLQKLTTRQPDDSQVEVAVVSLLSALDAEAVEEVKRRGPVAPGASAALCE